MRLTKKVVVSFVLVLLLVVAFWLGRVTSRERKANTSHEETPKAMKSSSEAAPHEHTGNEPPGHDESGKKPSGLTLTADQKANIGLKTVTADLRPIENVIRVAGVVRPHPDREAQVSSRVSGKVVGLFFKVGDAVPRGQRLAEVQSAEIQKVQVDLMQAENKLTLAKAELERIQNLVESKIAARKELIAAQNQHQSIVNEIQGLEQQLTILGLTETAVKKMREQKTIATFSVAAPIGGVIAERNVVLGETVEPSKVIFKILDPSVVFVEGDAFEESLRELKVGQSVRIRLASYPDEVFAGKISRLGPTIDPQKRTLRLWVEVVNPSGKLKPNLFSEMNIVLGGQGEVLAIPIEALISTEGENFVFVEEKGSFRRADVVLGARDDRFVEVKKGLLPGDRVVTDGKQQLYTQSLIARQGGAALGGHTH
ncbi:MAG TPA: efflux RND transporter periplasmic adaptor subunit [Candidatus Binatia bacterium]